MKKLVEQIVKLLKSHNYTIEIVGNLIHTPNCTIEVWKNGITVNEKPVSFDQVLDAVSQVEDSYGKMITVKCHYEDGDTITTGFNGSEAQARHFFVGQIFNTGSVTDNSQRCVMIEVI